MASQPSEVKVAQDENTAAPSVDTAKQAEPGKPLGKPNFHALLLNRNKKPLAAKNSVSQVPSTPSNIKRLQVNKWFNSPTDNMFSPCTKKLYKKAEHIQASDCTLNLTEEMSDSMEAENSNENQQVAK